MFGNLGWTEILVIGGLGLLLFGQRRIPDLAKGLGEGLRIFRKELARPEAGDKAEPTSESNATSKSSA